MNPQQNNQINNTDALLEAVITQNNASNPVPLLENTLEQNQQQIDLLSQIANKAPDPKNPSIADLLTSAIVTKVFSSIKGEQGEKGADGKDYILTENDKQEIASIVSSLGDFTDAVANKVALDIPLGLDLFNDEEVAFITSSILKQIPQPKDGKDAVVDYNLIKAELNAMVSLIKPIKGDKGEKGEDGNTITPAEIVEKLESLPAGQRLSYDKLDDLPNLVALVKGRVKSDLGYLRELSDVSLPTVPTANDVLTWDGSKWVASAGGGGGGGMSIGGTVTSGTAGSILFIDPTATLAQDNANLFWDNTNNRLGIGTSTPEGQLHLGATNNIQKFFSTNTTFTDLFGSTRAAVNYYKSTLSGAPVQSTNAGEFHIISNEQTSGSMYGIFNQTVVPSTNSNNLSVHQGLLFITPHAGTGTVTTLVGANLQAYVSNTAGIATTITGVGTVAYTQSSTGGTTVKSIDAYWGNLGAGTLTEAYGLKVNNVYNSGTTTNTYGVWVGDITTGTQTNTPYSFYASDANAIGLYSAGKVGINATAPTSMLDVVASSSSTVGQIVKAAASQTADLMQFQNSSGTALTVVDESGNVGIGTSSPQAQIHTLTSSILAGLFDAADSSTAVTGGSGIQLSNTNATTNNRAGFFFADTANGGPFSAAISAVMVDRTNHYGALAFTTKSTSGYADRMYITSGGNVGINTSSPTTKLHIKDTATTQITLEGATSYTSTIGMGLTSVLASNRPDLIIDGGFNAGYYSTPWLASAGRNNFTARISSNDVQTITAGNSSSSVWTHKHVSTQSGGTVYDVMSYTSGGAFQIAGPNISTTNIYSHTTQVAQFGATNTLYAYDATSKPLIVKAASSQTANLTEWQDSTGSILAKVGATGFFTSPGIRANAYNSYDNSISILAWDTGTTNSFYDGSGVVNLKLIGSTGVVHNDSGVSTMDFRMEGDTATHLFFLDASTDNIGINESAPTSKLHVSGPIATAVSSIKTANYTITATDSTIRVDTSSVSGFTVTLPTAVGITGRIYNVKDVGNNCATENVTVAADGSETIDGSATALIDANYKSLTFQSDGANWMIL